MLKRSKLFVLTLALSSIMSFGTSANLCYAETSGNDGNNQETNQVNNQLIARGQCGRHVFWTIDQRGNLHITGRGAMFSYNTDNSVPWSSYARRIVSLTIDPGVGGRDASANNVTSSANNTLGNRH